MPVYGQGGSASGSPIAPILHKPLPHRHGLYSKAIHILFPGFPQGKAKESVAIKLFGGGYQPGHFPLERFGRGGIQGDLDQRGGTQTVAARKSISLPPDDL
jgi:hypothetical protein